MMRPSLESTRARCLAAGGQFAGALGGSDTRPPERARGGRGSEDRRFKSADGEHLFGACLKYARSSNNAAKEVRGVELTEDQVKQTKVAPPRHGTAGKLIPYSDAFNTAHAEFKKVSGVDL